MPIGEYKVKKLDNEDIYAISFYSNEIKRWVNITILFEDKIITFTYHKKSEAEHVASVLRDSIDRNFYFEIENGLIVGMYWHDNDIYWNNYNTNSIKNN